MAFHSKYWSCSKLADAIRGTPKLMAGTSKQWREWTAEAKANHPYRFYLAEEALDQIQDFITWPLAQVDKVRYYINNRWVTKSHALTAHKNDIKPGSWQDVGDRILPCLFNELVDFVEIETAWNHCMWDDDSRKKYDVPWWRRGFPYLRNWRCPDAGLAHLAWACTLTNADFLPEDEKHLAVPTRQAEAAKEITILYYWWKEVYPNRPDPYDESGWTAICEKRREMGRDCFDIEEKTEEERQESRVSLDKARELEVAFEEEDTAMIIRLVNIRNSLWT